MAINFPTNPPPFTYFETFDNERTSTNQQELATQTTVPQQTPEERIAGLRAAYHNRRKEAAVAKREIDRLTNENKQLSAEKESLSAENQELLDKIAELSRKLLHAESQKDQLTNRTKVLKSHNESLEYQLALLSRPVNTSDHSVLDPFSPYQAPARIHVLRDQGGPFNNHNDRKRLGF